MKMLHDIKLYNRDGEYMKIIDTRYENYQRYDKIRLEDRIYEVKSILVREDREFRRKTVKAFEVIEKGE